MKKPLHKTVYIPQLHGTVRSLYTDDDGDMYIMMDGEFWSLDGYKSWLKDRYAINITYEFLD